MVMTVLYVVLTVLNLVLTVLYLVLTVLPAREAEADEGAADALHDQS